MNVTPRRLALPLLLALALVLPTRAHASFVTFESGQVRPLALSPDGTRLFAVNTPDNRLEIFDVGVTGLTHDTSVAVGLEPVAVAARSDTEVWVVNHLSDSISIVDLSGATPRVVRTLLVGDEPRDIVFAGTGGGRAFITTAHRGQQRISPDLAGVPGAGDPQLTTQGIGRADVWVFNVADLGSNLGGKPLAIVTLFGDTPRALATSPDGSKVYAAVFKSGNQTTAVSEGVVCNGFGSAAPCLTPQGFTAPGGLPPPSTDSIGENAPETGLIVKFNPQAGKWEDELGRDWSQTVLFDLPDKDVFAIDAATLAQSAVYSGVGTTLFNMAVNPINGTVYVSNTESRNEVRFEGPGIFGNSTVQGHLAESRITVLSGANVLPRHLNKHIDYDDTPAPTGVKEHSLATPVGMAVTPDGATLYVAAFGSSKIGVLSTAELAADTLDPVTESSDYIPVSGGGPSGLVLDSAHHRLYVLTRFDDAVSVVDLATPGETAHIPLHNPEPTKVVNGRRFLYDANLTSSNGEASCSSCHIFGDMDDLAWDLGNPDDKVKKNPIPINLGIALSSGFLTLAAPINGTGNVNDFHPMKGPMTTQTLRGMLGSGAMHWRGDRANPPGTAGSAFDEVNSFNNFNAAFTGLVGRDSELSTSDMQKFTNFALEITLPPNPNRAIDGSLNAAQQAGKNFFFGPRRSDGLANDGGPNLQLGFTCNGCHELDPAEKEFGTSKHASFENEEQIVKIPHLRNLYQKIGMFGAADVPFEDPLNEPFQGDQIRGFGFLHDGTVDTLFRFLNAVVFSTHSFGGTAVGFQNDTQRRNVEQYLLAFDSNLAPAVGQQVTLDAAGAAVEGPRISVLEARAAAGDCDLTVKGNLAGAPRGWLMLPGGTFQSDRSAEPPLADAALRALAATAGQELTFTCVPPGSGQRIGVDRDGDGFFDQDEIDAGTDPADPASYPGAVVVVGIRTTSLVLNDAYPPVNVNKRKMRLRSTKRGSIPSGVELPTPGGDGDPTLQGATLTVYRPDGGGTLVSIALPREHWRASGGNPAKRFIYSDPKGVVGPVRSVALSATTLTLRGVGEGLFALGQAPQDTMAVRLQLGTQVQLCAAAPAKATGNPPSTARNDSFTHFAAVPNTPAPVTCPPLPVSGSASRAFLVETPSLVDF